MLPLPMIERSRGKNIMTSPKHHTNLHLAIELAEDAGLTFLSIIEEHGTRLSDYDLYRTYLKADRLLASRQDAQDEDIARLRSCARMVMKRLLGKNLHDKGFYLPDVLLAYEARFIEQALEEERGSITRAANRLGLTHQRLIYVLESRHRELRQKRTPPVSRKSIIRKDK
jgi:DNA-binding NtrC family response regulator